MQLFTHLLSSYLQGMGDFFSALPREGMGRGFWGCGWGFPFYLPALSIISLLCWEK